VFVGGDFSQIELRLYAVMAQDQLLLKAFREDLDPHTLNAATLFANKSSEIMTLYAALMKKKKGTEAEQAELKYLRTVAKRFCFLEVYGGEEGKLYSVMAAERDKATGERVFHNLTEKRVSEWHRRWHENHPETKMWQAQKAREVRDNGYTQAIGDCRRRYFPGGATKKNAPPNHEIQGSAAWIANDSVLRIAEEIPFRSWSSWTGLCLQVHDQLMGLVPEGRAEEAIKIFEKCMYHEVQGLPIFAEVYATKDWAKQG
jgi:DNA polymerase-1